uniref:Integrase core domain containing protein n=1 Tax=Solanum tuberosum TaxID=4113 RepID=M1DVB1_SOLTU
MHEEDKEMEKEEAPIHQSIVKGPQKDMKKYNQSPKVMQPLPKISPPFPQRLKNKNEDEKFKKFLLVFKTLSINLLLVEALLEMPGDIHVVSTINVIDEAVASVSHLMCMSEPLEAVLDNYDEFEIQGYEEIVAALSGLGGGYSKTPLKLDIDLKNRESPSANTST